MPSLFGIGLEVYFILIILSIPIFFIWRWFLRKKITLERNRKVVVWICTIISTPLIYVGLVLAMLFITAYYPNRDFNKKDWLENKESRYEYSKDLIESRTLIGKTKNQTKQILGDNGNQDNKDTWYYDLGFRPELFNIDPDNLEIHFKNGKVIDVIQNKR